jgi:hypothetical protein
MALLGSKLLNSAYLYNPNMKKILLIISICSVLFACDLREQIIDLPYDGEAPKLSIIAYLRTTDTIIASVSRSRWLSEMGYEAPDDYYPANVVVSVYEDSLLFDSLARYYFPDSDTAWYWKSASGKKPQVGHSYYFVVSADGFETIYNTPVFMPEPVPLNTSVTIVDSIGIYEGDSGPDVNQIISSLSFSFDDPANQKNYYLCRADAYNTDGVDLQLAAPLNNVMGCKTGDMGPYFNDECFNGQTAQINIPVRSFWGNFNLRDAAYLSIKLYTLSYEEYRFYETYVDQPFLVEDALFREPYNTYSNIQNGYGHVTASSVNELVIYP